MLSPLYYCEATNWKTGYVSHGIKYIRDYFKVSDHFTTLRSDNLRREEFAKQDA